MNYSVPSAEGGLMKSIGVNADLLGFRMRSPDVVLVFASLIEDFLDLLVSLSHDTVNDIFKKRSKSTSLFFASSSICSISYIFFSGFQICMLYLRVRGIILSPHDLSTMLEFRRFTACFHNFILASRVRG
jgi:hypothetical protein